MNTQNLLPGLGAPLMTPRAPAIVRATSLDGVEHLARRVRARTHDAGLTFDRMTVDSTGAFLVGELERLDPTLHDPLVSYTWSRDIDLREDVTIADEVASFTNNSFAAAGGINPTGKAWIGKDTNAITGIALDIGKTAQPLFLWGMEVSYTIPELESAQKLGRPIDVAKLDGVKLKHNMDVDEMVYVGDTSLSRFGMVNHPSVTNVSAVINGAGGTPQWATKSPDEILADVNELLTSVWEASAWAVIPTELRLPPTAYSYLVSQKVSDAGNVSVLKFLEENNLTNSNGQKLNIQPLKWLIGRGVGGTPGNGSTVNRMMAYSKDQNRIRYPLVPLQRTPLEWRSIFHITTYFGRLGVVEVVYPETIGYRDGI